MKTNLIILIIITALLSSCAGMHKTQKKPVSSSSVVRDQQKDNKVQADDPPITEVKEKIVSMENKPVDPHEYFVITGSFRNPDNARKFQEQIASDGFISVLLRNEQGLYRVSVKSTDNITEARDKIRYIRNHFKNYEDTWLLISIK